MARIQAGPDDGREFRRDLVILLGSSLTVMAGATIAPCLPRMAVHFQDAPQAQMLVKMLLSVHALFIALTAPLMGMLMDRFGRRPVLAVSLLLYGLGGSSGAYLDSLYAIMAGRALLGVAVAGIMSGFTTLIGDYYQGERRNRLMGLQAAFTGFGGLVFLTAGGMLADVGWRYPFLIYLFAFCILPGALAYLYEPETAAHVKAGTEGEGMDSLVRFLPIYLLAFTGMVIFYMIPVQLPFHLKSLGGVSNTGIGVAIGTMNLVGAVSSMQFGRLKARFSNTGLFALFSLLMGLGYGVVWLAGGYYGVLAGMVVAGMGFGLLMPNVNVWLLSLVSARSRGRAVGGLTTFFLLGQFVSPMLFEPLVDRFGIADCFGAVGAVLLAGGVLFALSARSARDRG
ncbi:Bacillibactin exporter [Pseudodesulfovibrio hydrargyri]|uniref:Bacillibactin exporter n=1 Tax=Pseudodesulfovibrio hydrargyri TaxID=2125990 RepID=A0A1J5MZE7_9BACT|nr:MFS transporter [Pseudodesulfovibrio hydrargyri]OIQ51917.1 Bacillibactin exporter [Pseudodesulfovibrio hydrargyri]